MTQTPSGGGGELGIATLSIEVDAKKAQAQIDAFLEDVKKQLGALTVDPVAGSRQASRQVSRTSAPSPDTQVDVAEARDAVRRFNLRGFSAQLDAIAEQLDFNVDARNLNIRSSWTAFLTQLNEVSEQLAQAQTVRAFNINASWTAFLTQLNEVSEQLVQTQAGRELNIRSNWAAFLSQLDEVSEQLVLNRGAEQLNLRSSWTTFLEDLQEVSGQLQQRERAKNLNIRSSWAQFLEDLDQVAEDIAQLGKAKDLNIRSSWNVFLEQLQEVAQDLSQLRKAKDINLRSNWNRFLEDLENTAEQLTSLKSAEQLNLRTNWTQFLTELEEVDQDLKLSEGAKELNLRSSWQKFLGQLQEIKSDLDRSTLKARGFNFPDDPGFFKATFPKLQSGVLQKYEADLAAARDKAADAALKAFRSEQKLTSKRTQALRRRAGGAIGSGIIGGAFPLLFGQGAGASLGGLLGGLGGGAIGGQFGFGLSLIGTAIGAQVDQAIQTLGTLGKALESPIANFNELKNASLLSSKGVEKTAEALIQAGKNAEAEALIRSDLEARFGDLGNANELNAALVDLNSSFTELGVSIAQELAPALISGAKALADFIDKLNIGKLRPVVESVNQGLDFVSSSPELQSQFRSEFAEAGGKFADNGKIALESYLLAEEVLTRILNQNGILTDEQKRQNQLNADKLAGERALEESAKRRLELATRQSSRSLRDAEFDLRGAEGTRDLQGPALQIAQQLLAIDKARVVEADRIADANAAQARLLELQRQNAPKADQDQAQAELTNAANAVAEAGVRFRENLIKGARDAADALRDARQNFLDARVSAFKLLTPDAQRGLFSAINSQIDKLQKAAGISQGAVDSLQSELNRTGNISGLAELANTLRNVDTANENLVNAQQTMTEFLGKNTDALLTLGQKQWLVDVLVQANGRFLTDGDALPRVLQ